MNSKSFDLVKNMLKTLHYEDKRYSGIKNKTLEDELNHETTKALIYNMIENEMPNIMEVIRELHVVNMELDFEDYQDPNKRNYLWGRL